MSLYMHFVLCYFICLEVQIFAFRIWFNSNQTCLFGSGLCDSKYQITLNVQRMYGRVFLWPDLRSLTCHQVWSQSINFVPSAQKQNSCEEKPNLSAHYFCSVKMRPKHPSVSFAWFTTWSQNHTRCSFHFRLTQNY